MAEYLPQPDVLLHSASLSDLKLYTRPAVCFWLQAAYDHVFTTGQDGQPAEVMPEQVDTSLVGF